MNEIEKLKECFVEQLLPIRVYLFGSFANNTYTSESDLDFYIVVRDDITDIPALVEAFENDDSLYEEEAAARGMDVPTLKEVKALEKQNAEFARQMQQREKDAQNAEAWNEVLRQADEAKEIYPNLDIEKEMLNEDFAHLVAVNVPVQTAFEVIHHDELQAMSAKVIADQTARKVADSVKANKKRTGEGMGDGVSVVVKNDPKSLTDEDREKIYERVMAGEKISW